jgi:hypothetical protein
MLDTDAVMYDCSSQWGLIIILSMHISVGCSAVLSGAARSHVTFTSAGVTWSSSPEKITVYMVISSQNVRVFPQVYLFYSLSAEGVVEVWRRGNSCKLDL